MKHHVDVGTVYDSFISFEKQLYIDESITIPASYYIFYIKWF